MSEIITAKVVQNGTELFIDVKDSPNLLSFMNSHILDSGIPSIVGSLNDEISFMLDPIEETNFTSFNSKLSEITNWVKEFNTQNGSSAIIGLSISPLDKNISFNINFIDFPDGIEIICDGMNLLKRYNREINLSDIIAILESNSQDNKIS